MGKRQIMWWVLVALLLLAIIGFISIPNLLRSRLAANESALVARDRVPQNDDEQNRVQRRIALGTPMVAERKLIHNAELGLVVGNVRSAGTIKDTLEVSEKLSDVRDRIERLRIQIQLMTHDIEMSLVNIALMQEQDAQVFGIHWRPAYSAKIAIHESLAGMGDWVDWVAAVLIKLPLIALWALTVGGILWRYPLGALEDGTDNLASVRERNGSEERRQLSSDGIGGRFERLEWLLPLHRHRHRIPAAQTQCRNPAMHIAPDHFVDQSNQYARSARSNRMSQGNRAAVDVDAIHIQPKFADDSESLH